MKYIFSALCSGLLVLSLIFSISSCSYEAPTVTDEVEDPSAAQAKSLTLFLDAWNSRDANSIQDFLTADFERLSNGKTQADGLEAMRELMNTSFATNDAKVTILETFYSGNKALVKWTYAGTNIGPLSEEIPATNKAFTSEGATIMTFDDSGMIQKSEIFMDTWSRSEQLGFTKNPPGIDC